MTAPMKAKGNQKRSTAPPNGHNSSSHIKCIVCAKVGRTLDCCKLLRGPCLNCTEIHQLLNREINQIASKQADLQTKQNDAAWHARCNALETQIKNLQDTSCKVAQEKNDYIKSLKRQTEEADVEDKRLKDILEERKATLKLLQKQLSDKETPLEYIIKESKKGKKNDPMESIDGDLDFLKLGKISYCIHLRPALYSPDTSLQKSLANQNLFTKLIKSYSNIHPMQAQTTTASMEGLRTHLLQLTNVGSSLSGDERGHLIDTLIFLIENELRFTHDLNGYSVVVNLYGDKYSMDLLLRGRSVL
ncbi:hypothetical protein PTMSG1_03205 [Pyrenophora teres f. maculata]|nr:hypothetical protein PTMSG1_03205 [Pyrenophora teres f. maculata]